MNGGKASLWVFGDSFSTPYDRMEFLHCSEYVQWKGYTPLIYPQILSQKFNLPLHIHSRGGWDNYSIFEAFCNQSQWISEDDIVIIGWTGSMRFRLWNDGWISHTPQSCSNDLEKGILLNRLEGESGYSTEVDSWIRLIKNRFPSFHFSTNPQSSVSETLKFRGIQTIGEETSNEVEDGHPSEAGHQQLAAELSRIIRRSLI
jgi:hypothetical protein